MIPALFVLISRMIIKTCAEYWLHQALRTGILDAFILAGSSSYGLHGVDPPPKTKPAISRP